MGELGFGARSLWVHVLDDQSRPTQFLVQIEDIPDLPEGDHLDSVVQMARHFIVEGSSNATVVFLLTRPGRRGLTPEERVWARGLQAAVARAGLPVWPVHCANDQELLVCAPDDLVPSA